MSELPEQLQEAVDAIKEVYRFDSGGGYLHSTIDDGNVDSLPSDEDIDEAINWKNGKRYSPQARKRYKRCVDALWKLTIDGRECACAIAHGQDVNEWINAHIESTGECHCCSDFELSDLISWGAR